VKRSWTRALPVVAALALLVGCGGQSDKDKVKSTVQSYVDGLASRDGKKVCDQLAASVQTQVKQRAKAKDCQTAINTFESSATGRAVAPAFKTAKIKEVNAKGNTAAATVTVKVNGSDSSTTIPLEKVKGDWKITAPAEG
jgi:hypothetical protein